MITPYGSDRGKGVWGKTQLSMEGGGTLLTDHAVKSGYPATPTLHGRLLYSEREPMQSETERHLLPPPFWTECQERRGSMVTNSAESSAQWMPSTVRPMKKHRMRRRCMPKLTER